MTYGDAEEIGALLKAHDLGFSGCGTAVYYTCIRKGANGKEYIFFKYNMEWMFSDGIFAMKFHDEPALKNSYASEAAALKAVAKAIETIIFQEG